VRERAPDLGFPTGDGAELTDVEHRSRDAGALELRHRERRGDRLNWFDRHEASGRKRLAGAVPGVRAEQLTPADARVDKTELLGRATGLKNLTFARAL
jgi:hypothetical protein